MIKYMRLEYVKHEIDPSTVVDIELNSDDRALITTLEDGDYHYHHTNLKFEDILKDEIHTLYYNPLNYGSEEIEEVYEQDGKTVVDFFRDPSVTIDRPLASLLKEY